MATDSGKKLFVGPRFRRIRQQLGLSQTQIAEGLGISPSYINLIERNQRPVTAQILLRLAETYDLDLRDLATADEDRFFAELNEIFSDPLFRQIDLPKQELRDLAELWHWRSRTRRLQEEGRMPTILDSRGLTIERLLQLSSAKAAEEGMAPPPIDGDFPAFGKPYRSLTRDEFSIATSIAMERHRAFNWMCGYAPGNRWAYTPTET